MTVNHSIEEYAQALREAHGLVTHAAELLGVTRQAVTQRLAKHPTLAKVRDEARDGMTDVAEHALFTAMQQGEAWAVLFYLKTQGQSRGYVERSEQTHAVSGEVRIRIEAVDDRPDPRNS